MTQHPRVAVLTGGSTPERDVAFAGAAEVVTALRSSGHDVTVVDTTSGPLDAVAETALLSGAVGRDPPTVQELRRLVGQELGPRLVQLEELRSADVVFPVLHGKQGEGGELQALLDLAGIPYVGSDALGSALAMDKDLAKRLFRDAGLSTADWVMWPATTGQIEPLGLPLIVKPSRVGSTVGLSLIDGYDELDDAVAIAREFDEDVMIERYIAGAELTVGIVGDSAMAVGEIRPSHPIFDYECKYTPGLTEEIFPAEIPEELARSVQAAALDAHRTLKLRDFSRVDFIQGHDQKIYCLEVNTLPGLTTSSLLPQSARAAGLNLPELCMMLCARALERAKGTNPSGGGSR